VRELVAGDRPGCAECGGSLDSTTIGCTRCRERHQQRRTRARHPEYERQRCVERRQRRLDDPAWAERSRQQQRERKRRSRARLAARFEQAA
jgi:hypothetical protein